MPNIGLLKMGNVPVKYRIFLMSIVAIVGMLVFAGMGLVDKNRISSEMEDLNRLSRFGAVVSALVHELRKERGMSAGFIAGKAQSFAADLPGQHTVTDEKRGA